jgi:hypothetical protein
MTVFLDTLSAVTSRALTMIFIHTDVRILDHQVEEIGFQEDPHSRRKNVREITSVPTDRRR